MSLYELCERVHNCVNASGAIQNSEPSCEKTEVILLMQLRLFIEIYDP